MPSSRAIEVLLLVVALGACAVSAGCTEPETTPTGPSAARTADEEGVFARLGVDGRTDRLDEIIAARDRAIDLIEALASAADGDARTVRTPSGTLETPAHRLRAIAAEARGSLDELRAPIELGGAFLFGDSHRGGETPPPPDGAHDPEVRLEYVVLEVARSTPSAPRLRLSTEDLVAPTGADGTVDRLEVEWSPSRGHTALRALVRSRWDIVTAEVDFGEGQVMKLASPRLSRFLMLATARFHGPAIDVYGKAAQDGTLRIVAPRERPPARTSFPPLASSSGAAPSAPTMAAYPLLPRAAAPPRPIR